MLIAGNGQALSVGGDIDYFTSALPGTIGALTSKMTEPFHGVSASSIASTCPS